MTQKEAIIEALNLLGGKANLNDIYRIAYPLADFTGSKDWKATIRCYLQKETDAFRSTKRSWWELVSYQEEVATLKQVIVNLQNQISLKEKEIDELKKIPTEDAFVKRIVEETKQLYKHEKEKIEVVRQIFYKVGRNDAEEELDAWIEGRAYRPTINVSGDYVITKHIDNEVNGVSSGATGINVNNKQEIA